jgi:para-nitrobenzyl esterase
MKLPLLVCAAMALAPIALAQDQAKPPAPRASETIPAKAKLTVATPGWSNGGDIAFDYTQYRDNKFPGLKWSAGPSGTRSYTIIMQDVDSGRPMPFLHWTMYDIPAGVTQLPAGMQPGDKPAGSSYGPNYKGAAQAYLGPRTPPGPKHHYYLQVFALDTVIPADPAITLDGLTGQMTGHVLASGETMGLGQADTASR